MNTCIPVVVEQIKEHRVVLKKHIFKKHTHRDNTGKNKEGSLKQPKDPFRCQSLDPILSAVIKGSFLLCFQKLCLPSSKGEQNNAKAEKLHEDPRE